MTFEASGLEYSVSVLSFSAPVYRGRMWEDDPGEVELAPTCDVYRGNELIDTVSLDTALLAYAAEKGWTLDRARQEVEDQALEAACEEAADRWEDQRASYDEDRRWL